MNKKKKIILTLSILVVVAVASAATLLVLKNKAKSSRTADVFPVSYLGYSYMGTTDILYGNVAVDKEQKIYLQATDQISEIKVSEGDEVKAGDVLLVYDTTSQQLKLESMRAEVEVARANVVAAQRDLTILQNTVPVEPATEEPSTEDTATENTTTENITTENTTTENTTTENTTTENTTTENAATEDDTTDIPSSESGDSQAFVSPKDVILLSDPENENDIADDGGITYTRAELDKAIADKQSEIKKLNIDYQLAQIELETMEYQAETGEIRCNFDGVVKTVSDQETAILNNEPFIVVSGNDGYMVLAYVGELQRATLSIGDTVSMLNYDNFMNYTGVITEISDIPVEDYYSYDGTEETYYTMTITVDAGSDDLTQGMYMEVTVDSAAEYSDSLYIPMAFVDKENGLYYVMKEVDGRLEKVFVQTGAMESGSIEILSGVTMDDYLAIPYSKNAAEGAKTVEKDGEDAYGY